MSFSKGRAFSLSSPTQFVHYADDIISEDDSSDTTKVSLIHPHSRSKSTRPQRINSKHRFHHTDSILTWTRWGVILVLQVLILLGMALFCRDLEVNWAEKDTRLRGKGIETGDDINGLYKTISHTYSYLTFDAEKYVPNMTSNDNREKVRRNWDLLMPLGSGSVAIPDYKDHPLLGNPITDDPIRSGPLFEASWTHALHCLYYSVDSYHQLIVNGRTPDDNPDHAAHCFEYLRTNILCNLDMTLEGELSTTQDERGQPHVCRNRDEAVEWIEDRRVDDLQDIVGP